MGMDQNLGKLPCWGNRHPSASRLNGTAMVTSDFSRGQQVVENVPCFGLAEMHTSSVAKWIAYTCM